MLTPLGVYVFNVLTMGLSNSNDLFESASRELLQSLVAKVNIIDILVFWSTQQEHDSNVKAFLERFLEIDFEMQSK